MFCLQRCIVNTHAIDPVTLTEFFGTLSKEWALDCLKEMLVTNPQQNLQLVRGGGQGTAPPACSGAACQRA